MSLNLFYMFFALDDVETIKRLRILNVVKPAPYTFEQTISLIDLCSFNNFQITVCFILS